MKKSKFSEAQIINILKLVETGRLVKDVCREYGVGESTYFKWKSKYGGLELSEVKRLKGLEDENRKLKRIYADLALENHALKDLIEKKL